jgi:hypothetical protein
MACIYATMAEAVGGAREIIGTGLDGVLRRLYDGRATNASEMTIDELFDYITKVIASPHTAITEHDKRRAIQVFLGFDDYLIDALDGYCEEGCEIDFGAYAVKILDELEGK